MKPTTEKTQNTKPKKDYFGWFYNKRTTENKIFLHIYTLLFLSIPIYFSIYQSGIFLQMGIIFNLLIFLYTYGFTIHHFPTSRKESIILISYSLLYLLLVGITGGEQSLSKTLQIDGATLLCTILLMSCFFGIKNFKKVKIPNIIDYRLIYIIVCLVFLITFIIAKTLSFLQEDNITDTLINQLFFLLGVIAALSVHHKYLRDIDPVLYWNSTSKKNTLEIGKSIVANIKGGDILLLHGEMGAGKTTITKGFAEGLGITKDVTSPTFGLMHVYEVHGHESIKNLVHIDTYRLKDEHELIAIGAEEYFGAPDTVCIIEWPEKIETLLRGKKVKKIFLEHASDEKRKIIMQ